MSSPARRKRVVLADAARRAPTGRAEPAEPPALEDALVRGLVRAQLALAVRMGLLVLAGLGALPLLFAVAPGVATVTVAGVNLPWLLLGVAAFPFLVSVGWAYVRLAERNEQEFAAVVRRR